MSHIPQNLFDLCERMRERGKRASGRARVATTDSERAMSDGLARAYASAADMLAKELTHLKRGGKP